MRFFCKVKIRILYSLVQCVKKTQCIYWIELEMFYIRLLKWVRFKYKLSIFTYLLLVFHLGLKIASYFYS